jgi:hypothetical protein
MLASEGPPHATTGVDPAHVASACLTPAQSLEPFEEQYGDCSQSAADWPGTQPDAATALQMVVQPGVDAQAPVSVHVFPSPQGVPAGAGI